MKGNLLNKVWLRVMMIVAVMTSAFAGTAWAQQDVVYKTALFGSSYNSASVSDNTSTWMATNGDFKVILANFSNSGNYIACGRRYYTSVASISTAATIDKPITKVALTINSITNASSVSSITLQISSDYVNWNDVNTFDKSATNTQVTRTVTIPENQRKSNLFYRIAVTTTGTTAFIGSTNYVQISKVEYFREPDDPNAVKTPTISGTEWPMFQSQTIVTIDCETADATILYSKDGGTTWIDYNNTPFTLTESTTIKAKATKDGMIESQISSKSFSKASEVKDVTWDLEKSTHSSSNSNAVTWSTDYAVMTLAKGGSTANANGHLGQSGGTYFYNGQMLQIAPIDGYTIVSVDIIVSGGTSGLIGDAWNNATTTSSGSKITVTPEDGTMPISVACTAGSITNFFNEVTGENYRTILDVTVHYAPTSLPYIAVANNVLEVTSAETSGTIELVYNKVTPSEVAVEAHDANGTVTWITPSINTTTGKLVYTIAANTTTAERTAEIWVHCEKAEVTVTVTQAAPVVVTIGTLGYSTLYYGTLNLIVPGGITAYTYKLGTPKPVISTIYYPGDVIPAGSAVVLKTDTPPSVATGYPFAESVTADDPDEDNDLRGSDVAGLTQGENCLFYALSHKGGKNVGFYWMAEDGGAFNCPAHKAYLAVPVSSNPVKSYFFDDEDDPTGIEDVNVNLNDNEEIYDLSGRRLNKMQKGINIINGKKILK